METLVILPTIRNATFIEKYLENAQEHNYDLSRTEFMVLTEDFVDKLQYKKVFSENGIEAKVLNQADRDKELTQMGLSKYAELIPKRSRAKESFGLLYMWANDHKYGITIDDDTRPIKNFDFFGEHLANLNFHGELKEYKSDKKFVNVLHQSFKKYHLYPRGYPYGAMGEILESAPVKVSKVGMSQGLWVNIPDLDAVRILFDGSLNGQSKTRLKERDYGDNFTVAIGNYLTVCSMNLAFRRELIPGFYQYKMGDNQWKVDRFDDIWSGIVAKKLMDVLGYRIITGKPLCRHEKAPRSTFKDLKVEVAGLEANEVFYKIVDKVETREKDPFAVVLQISNALKQHENDFIAYCGNHLSAWIDALAKLG